NDKALELDPHNVVAWYNKCQILEKLEKHLESVECYNRAPELYSVYNQDELQSFIDFFDDFLNTDHEDASIWYNKSVIFQILENNQEALKCLNKALELKPDFEPAKKAKEKILKKL
ncbi:MAG: tetratricopeptide repeat protein, partial [Methanobacterium sp.]|nr:tetratricopeptide repeat protein [Methanobacterium sp.]